MYIFSRKHKYFYNALISTENFTYDGLSGLQTTDKYVYTGYSSFSLLGGHPDYADQYAVSVERSVVGFPKTLTE